MKGFIHIVEIIIIFLVVFILILQFSTVPSAKSDWNKAKLTLLGNDILFSLDKKGVNWLDAEIVKDELEKMLSGMNILYSIVIENAIKPEIRVGCLCNDAEFNQLNSILSTGFSINGESITYTVNQIGYTNGVVETNLNFPVIYDVIYMGNGIFNDKQGTEDDKLIKYKRNILSFLRWDRGIVEVRDLHSDDLDIEIQGTIFGLEQGSNVGLGDITFTVNYNNPYYNIRKYFSHIPNPEANLYSENHQFTNFLDAGEMVIPTRGETNRIVLAIQSSGTPALIINDYISEGKGRTVWLSDGIETIEEETVLLKSIIAWASGEKYEIVQSTVKNPVTLSYFKVINNDMYQPIRIALSIGYIY